MALVANKLLWLVAILLVSFLCSHKSVSQQANTSSATRYLRADTQLFARFYRSECSSAGCSTNDGDAELPKVGALVVPAEKGKAYQLLCSPSEEGEYGFHLPAVTQKSIDIPGDDNALKAFFRGERQSERIQHLLKEIGSAIRIKATDIFVEQMFSQIEMRQSLLNTPAHCRSGLLSSARPVHIIVERLFGTMSAEVSVRNEIVEGRSGGEALAWLIVMLKVNYHTRIDSNRGSNSKLLAIQFRHPQLFAFRATPISRLSSDYEALFK